MNSIRADEILTAAEEALAAGEKPDLVALGFWRLVAAAKTDTQLRDAFADRVASIDRRALRSWAFLTVPIGAGTALMILGSVAALVAIALAYGVDEPWNGLLLLLGTGALLVTTHGLAHLVVGSVFGMRFTDWFIGSPFQPQPGVKVDYASYLRAPAARRAAMHAAGAVVTKLLPFLMLGAAAGMDAPTWAWWCLIGVGLASIATDFLWSVRSSDWKKYRRERSYVAREL
jgi:hypothetical protein